MQRLTAFGLSFFMGILSFTMSAFYIPVLLLKARKFALLYSMGSLFFLMRYVFTMVTLNMLLSKLITINNCFLALRFCGDQCIT